MLKKTKTAVPSKLIVMTAEYANCPILTVIDTPGFILKKFAERMLVDIYLSASDYLGENAHPFMLLYQRTKRRLQMMNFARRYPKVDMMKKNINPKLALFFSEVVYIILAHAGRGGGRETAEAAAKIACWQPGAKRNVEMDGFVGLSYQLSEIAEGQVNVPSMKIANEDLTPGVTKKCQYRIKGDSKIHDHIMLVLGLDLLALNDEKFMENLVAPVAMDILQNEQYSLQKRQKILHTSLSEFKSTATTL
ncbi:hypothetical protein R6Q59_022517 [Mikania micrantha]